jgi:ribosomal protein S18 acetylase RimI-like enzyme
MSELRPATPVERPASARRRSDGPPDVDPPTVAELERIERHLVSLPVHEGASVTEDDDLGALLVRRPRAGAGHQYAAMPRWDAAEIPASLARLRERMRAEGAWPCLVLTDRPGPPAGWERLLAGTGWLPVSRERVLWVGLAATVPHLDPGLRIEAVQPRSAGLHETLERRIFGLPAEAAEARRAALAAALEGGGLRAYIVRAGDEPVAVARLSQGEGVAALVGVGVVPERRREGFGRLITIVATRAGLAGGNRLVWLSVEEGDARAVALYTSLGFRPAFGWTRWLDADEHAAGPARPGSA